jgi:hypothetical protein
LISKTGDLTNAPMLAITSYNESKDEIEIVERWAFMDYQVTSVLMQLLKYKTVTFIS